MDSDEHEGVAERCNDLELVASLQIGRAVDDRARIHLHANVCAGAAVRVEQRLRRPAIDDRISDGVGMLLIYIIGPTHVAVELDACSLLNDVCCLVRCGTQFGLCFECDAIGECEGTRAYSPRRGTALPADRCSHMAYVVISERPLNLMKVR